MNLTQVSLGGTQLSSLSYIRAGTIVRLSRDLFRQGKLHEEQMQCPTETPSASMQTTMPQSVQKSEIGFGFFSQKNRLDHHRAFNICLIAWVP